MPQKTKPNHEQVTAVVKWILQANDERDIRQAFRDKYPDADDQLALAAAVEEIAAIGHEDPAFTRGWALASTRELVRKMIEIGDFANAMRGIKQVAQLSDTE